ncbi:unnamed protein product [Arctogadus glacialis]
MSHGSLPPLARAVLGVSPPSPDLKYHLPLRLLPVFGKVSDVPSRHRHGNHPPPKPVRQSALFRGSRVCKSSVCYYSCVPCVKQGLVSRFSSPPSSLLLGAVNHSVFITVEIYIFYFSSVLGTGDNVCEGRMCHRFRGDVHSGAAVHLHKSWNQVACSD